MLQELTADLRVQKSDGPVINLLELAEYQFKAQKFIEEQVDIISSAPEIHATIIDSFYTNVVVFPEVPITKWSNISRNGRARQCRPISHEADNRCV